MTPPSPKDTSHTLEADDSKTDTSLIEGTPLAKRRGGRGRGRGRGSRTTRSMASLASIRSCAARADSTDLTREEFAYLRLCILFKTSKI